MLSRLGPGGLLYSSSSSSSTSIFAVSLTVVAIQQQQLRSGQPSELIDIPFGVTNLTVRVTSEDGSDLRRYTVAVNRTARAPMPRGRESYRPQQLRRFRLNGNDRFGKL